MDNMDVDSDVQESSGSKPAYKQLPTINADETPLEVVPNDLDDETHMRLDKEVFNICWEPTEIKTATSLLAAIVSTSKSLNKSYNTIPKAFALLKEQPQLSNKLKEAWAAGTFRDIRNLKILRTYRSQSPPINLTQSMLHNSTPELKYFKQAFETEYTGPFPGILLATMDRYSPGNQFYNRSFSIVQSSGMGKSRLVDHSAQSRFAFPFNLHEQLPTGSKSYPPFDENVRDYLTFAFADELRALTRHFAFLEALFTVTANKLKDCKKGSAKEVAQQWYRWMSHGATATTVGTNRIALYNQVIGTATQLEEMSPADLGISGNHTTADILDTRRNRLINAAGVLCDRLEELHGAIENGFLAFAYFDEAHTLHNVGKTGTDHKPFFALMHVLSQLENSPIFFIFLSTNSSLNALTPTGADCPSLRVNKGWKLIPPFFELCFDGFCYGLSQKLRDCGKLTLNGVSELEQVVKFGRPMWHSHFSNVPRNGHGFHPTIALAMMKMGQARYRTDPHVKLACLDCRVLIQYHPIRAISRDLQDDLVKTRMRIVFNITEARHFTWSGYPSEPMLAEAAARLLNNSKFIDEAPQILDFALQSGLLARGERGELVARTLFTVAHDLAVIKHYPEEQGAPYFHRPIKFLHLLENLVSPAIWGIIRNAKPFHAFRGDKTLERAFETSWVHFSHFVQLGDHDSFTLHGLSELLKRGGAAQTYDNQYNVDIGIPVLVGHPAKTVIDKSNTTVFQCQVKNTADAVRVLPDPELVGKSGTLPVISVTMQLGVKDLHGKKVKVESTDKSKDSPAGGTRSTTNSTPNDIERRHYVITLYGCTSETYNCIPVDSQVYSECLRAEDPFIDFPRRGCSENEKLVDALQPRFYDKKSLYHTPWSDLL